MCARWTGLALGLSLAAPRLCGAGGVDTGLAPALAAPLVTKDVEASLPRGAWLRVRTPAVEDRLAMRADREALSELRARGFRICALVRWEARSWRDGVRENGPRRLPVNLGEAFARSAELARTYEGLVDAWEIENEPDISFVEENAETYAAFLKACYLGFKSAAADKPGVAPARLRKAAPGGAGARVLAGAMAQPPGPYLERLWENGAAAHTDGFNFHYYGYAEDFSGVYWQFEHALANLGEIGTAGAPVELEHAGKKNLPVFVTEYGYGLLDAAAAEDAPGRLRQWRWFRAVDEQLRRVGPEAAMSFVLMPYDELGREFGLLRSGKKRAPATMRYEAGDFGGDERSGRWAEKLGEIGESRALFEPTPALVARAAEPWPAPGEGFATRAGAVSPVVIDFIARTGLEENKRFRGYFVSGFDAVHDAAGVGEMIVYNFGARAVDGVLSLEGLTPSADSSQATIPLTLAPGQRRIVPVAVVETRRDFAARRSTARFVINDITQPDAVWTSAFYPNPAGMEPSPVMTFAAPKPSGGAEGEAKAEAVPARSTASEEPVLRRAGRWRVTDGVEVEERGGTWRFVVKRFPAEPARPAMAELALPAKTTFPADTLLTFSHRLGEAGGGAGDRTRLDAYVRTENGNLYHVWPHPQPTKAWRTYVESVENLGMAFFGRAELPWRFRENTPTALVFFFRPAALPAVFEIKDAALVRWKPTP